MAVTYTPDLGFAKPDLYTDQKETYYADVFDQANRALGGYLAVVTGDANYTLQDVLGARESRTIALKFTSTLTAARQIKIDTTAAGKYRARVFILWNATGGGFKVTVLTTAGGSTGIDISNGCCRLLWHDGTNVYGLGPEVTPTTGQPPSVSARVYNNAAISVAHNTATALTFNTERWDSHAIHSTSSNTSRLVAPSAGLYAVGGNLQYASGAGTLRVAQIKLNGTTILANIVVPPVSGDTTVLNVNTQWSLAAGDYVELIAYQDSGGGLNVNSTADYSPEFWLTRLGPQP